VPVVIAAKSAALRKLSAAHCANSAGANARLRTAEPTADAAGAHTSSPAADLHPTASAADAHATAAHATSATAAAAYACHRRRYASRLRRPHRAYRVRHHRAPVAREKTILRILCSRAFSHSLDLKQKHRR
jgi:hypothetical protein